MDRNIRQTLLTRLFRVALRKESVDRNMLSLSFPLAVGLSLSVRRAWIEILTDDVSTGGKIKSLSVRRAWIEI